MTFAENEQILGRRTEGREGEGSMGREGKRAPKRREGERLSRYRRFCRYQFFPLSRSPSFISRRPMSRMIWAPFCGGRQLLLILLQTADVTKCGYTASRKDFEILVVGLVNFVLVNLLRPIARGKLAQSTHK